MTKIRLDWKNLFSPSDGQFVVERDNDERIVRQKERYAEIFKPGLGTVKGVIAKLHLKDNVYSRRHAQCRIHCAPRSRRR